MFIHDTFFIYASADGYTWQFQDVPIMSGVDINISIYISIQYEVHCGKKPREK